MVFLDDVEKYFGTRCLYEAIGARREDNQDGLKKAYYKQSLMCHPDRVSETDKSVCTNKFQVLGKIYEVLSKADTRALYDETGEACDDMTFESRDWDSYWKLLFGEVTEEKISKFYDEYKHSDIELADVKRQYLQHQGDMDDILSSVMCAGLEDEDRFRQILQEAIDSGELPAYKKFTNESRAKKEKRKRKYAAEAVEAEALRNEKAIEGNADLMKIISSKRKERAEMMEGFFDDLEARYCQPKKDAKKSTKSKQGKKSSPKKRKR